MSFIQPRGRHSAPNKLLTSLNSTARVSAAVAVGGGLVASAVFSQSAQAASTPAQDASAPIKASLTLTQVAGKHIAKPASAPIALSQIRDAVAVQPQMSAITARSYVAPAPAPVTPAAPTVDKTVTTSVGSSASTAGDSSGGVKAGGGVASPAPVSSAPAATGGVIAIAIAKRYIGVPYVYGGSTPSGFDCSGFTSYVYAQLGISLPHQAAVQQSTVRSVSNPQPGDLVFFGTPAYHVGIYLGNGMMIDENHPGSNVGIRPLYSGVSGYARP